MRVYDAVIIIIKSLKKAHSVRIALEHKEKSTGKKNPSTAFNPIHTRKWSLCWACFHFIHSNNENLFGFFRRWSFLRLFFLFVTSLHSNNTLFIPPAAGRMKTVYITQYHPRGDGSCGSDRYNALGQRRKKRFSLSFVRIHTLWFIRRNIDIQYKFKNKMAPNSVSKLLVLYLSDIKQFWADCCVRTRVYSSY